MAQPQWTSDPGSLGVIPEGIFYSVPLRAEADGQDVFFRLIAGQLPAGIQVTTNGIIEGVPRGTITVQGVPTEVSQDITSKFAIRAYTVRAGGVVDRIADRTFSITVTGQDIPEFVTPAGNVGIFFDGTKAVVPIQFTDNDIDDIVRVRLLAGELPPGLVLNSSTGVISGIILPLVGPPGTAEAGYDNTQYDQYPFDFVTRSASRNYQFILEITDGKQSNARTFEIFVYAKSDMQASVTTITSDNTWITADVTPTRVPVLLNNSGFIGRYRSDNRFAYKFDAIDFDDDAVVYEISADKSIDSNSLPFDELYGGVFAVPPGLVLDPNTGWFYGYLPDQGATELNYRFGVRVKKKLELAVPWNPLTATYISGDTISYLGNNYTALISVPGGTVPTNTNYWMIDSPVASPYSIFAMTIIGDIETDVVWLTSPDLGTIYNGNVSTLSVQAVSANSKELQYRIPTGTNSRLPQGLTLQASGHITGRVSFNTFALDNGTTTFDQQLSTRLTTDETTFDSTYNFTVNAYSAESAQITLSVESIDVTNGGFGYTQIIPTFSPPETLGGITATGIVTLVNGFITAVDLLNPGSGYVNPPSVFFTPAQGGAQALVTTEISGGSVTKVNIESAGVAYSVPTVLISAPANPTISTQAVAGAVTIVNGVITNIAVSNPGIGYLTEPGILIIGSGTGATATANLADLNRFNVISIFRRFSVFVKREFNQPYQSLYIKCMPPQSDRDLIASLVQNQDIIPFNSLYRADDSYFGVSSDVVYNHAFGLTAASLDTYVSSLDLNHYWKNLTLGEIEYAIARDTAGNVIYEVVYSRVIDDLVNNQGQSVSKQVKLPYSTTVDGQTVSTVYPNSLVNMRDQVVDVVGQISPLLPTWMTSKQRDGRVLGFTPAWVIAYVKPGQGARVVYNIQQRFGNQLNLVDFKADRYEIDRSASFAWEHYDDSVESGRWIPQPPVATTFDNNTTNFDFGSTTFITPANTVTNTDQYDKYILYPRVNILG